MILKKLNCRVVRSMVSCQFYGIVAVNLCALNHNQAVTILGGCVVAAVRIRCITCQSLGIVAVRQMSQTLFGSDKSDRVLWLTQNTNEEELQEMVFNQMNTWPLSIIALEYGTVSPKNLHFLASALNDNDAFIMSNYDRASTEQAIFVIISDFEIGKYVSSDELDQLVKQRMKKDNWPDRVCQRIRHTIPLHSNPTAV